MNLAVEPGVVLSLITIVAGITIFAFIKSRHNERMIQLEMGVPLDNIKRNYFELKFGLLFMGIGVGILTAVILEHVFSVNSFEIYPAFIFLFGGLGLFISFFLIHGHNSRQEI